MNRDAEAAREDGAISRARIVAGALRVIDDLGVDGLTMRRLGAELGVDAMMVYRHFPNKAAVLDGVMSQIWAEVNVSPARSGGDWREVLFGIMRGLRTSLLAHPRAISIVGTRPASGAELLQLMDRLVEALVDAGMVVDARAGDLLNALVNFTVGHVLAEVGDPVGGDADAGGDVAVVPGMFPHLAAVFSSGWRYDAARQYESAVRAMIAGWAGAGEVADD